MLRISNAAIVPKVAYCVYAPGAIDQAIDSRLASARFLPRLTSYSRSTRRATYWHSSDPETIESLAIVFWTGGSDFETAAIGKVS